MASVIKIKRTSVSGNLPTTSNLSTGELALNIPDKRLYTSNSSAVLEIGSNPSTLSVNSAYSFPHTDGSAGQIMKTDGSGNLTFTDAVTSHVVTINSGNTATAGVVIILMFGILAIFSGLFMTHDPVSAYPDRILQSPSAEHWFGTDSNGMDVFSRVIYGAKFGFGIAIPAVTISVLIGVPVGLIAGYRGGILDEVLMRIFDGLRVFPSIILALAVVAATGQSLINVVLVLGFLDSPVFARLVRAEVLTLRSSILVESAVAAGNPTWRILFLHLLRN